MNYYEILGIPRTAAAEQIQKAYHGLALKYHPDVNQGDAAASEKFKEINKAYQALRHADKRKEYDATLGGGAGGAASKNGGRAARPPGSQPAQSYPPASSPQASTGNPLMDVLGGMQNAARANAGAPTAETADGKSSGAPTVELKLTMREALAGATKTVLINGRPLRIHITIER